MVSVNHPIYIAMDFSNPEEVNDFFGTFSEEHLSVKVGMELFYLAGPALLQDLSDAGCDIFLDLKLHDIPHTVQRTMKGLASLGVQLVNVHAAGGKQMMEAAMEGLEQGTPPGKKRPDCIAVTQLTSTSQKMLNDYLLINGKMEDVTVSYAELAKDSGLDGVVCSALEVPSIKKACGEDFITVTPGIRRSDDAPGDQQRITTPQKARDMGSDAIVVGRSITAADDPKAAYQQIKTEWWDAF